MPVEAQTVEYAYTGDGASTVFQFPSRFLSNADILVAIDQVEQLSGFVVAGAGVETGGTVTFSVAPAAGVRVSLVRKPPASQLIDFINGQTVLEGILDSALDKLTMLVQYLLRGLSKSVRLSDFDAGTLAPLPLAVMRSNRFLGFNADGALALVPFDDVTGAVLVPSLAARAKDFGALGDGVTDDTVAIQAALDYGASFGIPAELEAGTFVVASGTLDVAHELRGQGPEKTFIKRTTDAVVPLVQMLNRTGPVVRDLQLLFSAGLTSTTSLTVGTGSKVFTVSAAGANFPNGASVLAVEAGNGSNVMIGTVTSYIGNVLTVNVTTATGSGTIANWQIGRNDGNQAAARMQACIRGEVSRVRVQGRFYIGIEDRNGTACAIRNNSVHGAVDRAIYGQATTGAGNADENRGLIINHNFIDGEGTTFYGINLNGAKVTTDAPVRSVNVSDNTVTRTNRQGITAGAQIKGGVIDGNTVDTVYDASGVGILVQANAAIAGPKNIAISSNSVRAVGGVALYLIDANSCTATVNTFSGCGSGIIHQQAGALGCAYNAIANNSVELMTTFGIAYQTAGGGVSGRGACDGNTVTGCSVGSTGLSSDAGTDRVSFSGNMTFGNFGTNMTLGGSNIVNSGNISA